MGSTLPKILGQNKPDLLVDTTLFTVPLSKQAQFSLFVCNQGSAISRFTIALIPNGGALSTARYIAYNTPLNANTVFAASGLYMDGGDEVIVSSDNGDVSFTATGIEITP